MNEIINSGNMEYFSYNGSIKVKIMRGKKVYKEKIFHNSGRWPIFKHIAYSLAGQYTNADNWRPLVLALYSVPRTFTEDGKEPVIKDNTDPDWNRDPEKREGKYDWFNVDKTSIRRYANADHIKIGNVATFMVRPNPSDSKNAGIGQASITYQFLIPFTQLKIQGDNNGWNAEGYKIAPINLVCLYSKNNSWWNWEEGEQHSQSETYGNPNAFFFVTDAENGKLGSLLPKSITSNVGEYSLSIEWTLNFKSNSTYIKPEDLYEVRWIDDIHDKEPITEYYKWGTLPKCPFTDCKYDELYTEGDTTYAFAGWNPVIHLVDEESTEYTAMYWKQDTPTSPINPKRQSTKNNQNTNQ